MRRLIYRIMARQEFSRGVPLDYLRELADTSPTASFNILRFGSIGHHRRSLTRAPFHLARLAASQTEDYSTCVHIVVHFAQY